MDIDIYSDTVCPWCFIGKRHLEQALAQDGVTDARLRWHAFQLNPDLPPEGRDRKEYLDAKFGGPENAMRIYARVEEAGRAAGIEFQFGKIQRSPNTFNSHRLIRLAETQQRADAAVESLFRGYFLEGRDLGDIATLAELGRRAGLAGDLDTWLAGPEEAEAVRADLQTAGRFGIGGVPFFIFNRRYALSGAQPPEVFHQAMQAAREKSRDLN